MKVRFTLSMTALAMLAVACELAPATIAPPTAAPPTAIVVPPTAPPTPAATVAPPLVPTASPTFSPTPAPTALPTSTPTRTPPPIPTQAPPPARPATFAQYPQAILDYLNGNPRNWSALAQVIQDWGAVNPMPEPSSGHAWNGARNIAAVDIDGDGQEDMLVAVIDPDSREMVKGALLLYLRKDATYRLAQQLGGSQGSSLPRPNLFAVQDLLHVGGVQVVYTSTDCGAHTCFTLVDIVRWSGDKLASISSATMYMAYPDIKLQDSGHGTMDIVMHGGLIGSVGAGPQRARTEVFGWNGSTYTLTQQFVDPSNFRYFKVIDANALMLAKNYAGALALYQEAVSNAALEEYAWDKPTERANLQAFARFRIIVAQALLGDVGHAQAAYDDLLAAQPQHIYAEVAKTFWQSYAPVHSVSAGCGTVTTYTLAHPEAADVLANFGYANPAFTTKDVCPFR